MWGLAPWGTTPWGALASTGTTEVDLSDSLVVDLATLSEILPDLIDRLIVACVPSSTMSLYNTLSSGLRVEDATLIAWMMATSDSLQITATPTYTYTLIANIAETLRAADLVDSRLTAYETITEALAMHDMLQAGWAVSMADTVAFTDAFAAAMKAAANLVDSLVASAQPSCFATITMIASDSLAATATPSAVLRMMQDVTDEVVLFASVHADSGEFSSWVIGTENAAASEYTNFDFNSYTTFNGGHYAAGDAGLVKLGGDTDLGDSIAARIRSGVWNLGTGRIKGSMEMYAGIIADGSMVLKVLLTQNRVKKEYWYRQTAAASSTNQIRFQIGKGLSSVYWQFELCNQSGADFAVDTVAWHPLNLSRRI